MNNRKKDGGFKPSWFLVLIALVVGLVIPDSINPLGKIFGGGATSDKKKEEDKKTTTT